MDVAFMEKGAAWMREHLINPSSCHDVATQEQAHDLLR
jgi:hypothetical protein